jgi:hypothetical protein
VPAAIAEPSTTTTLPAPVPAKRQFAGFDTGDYPGDAVMTAWANGNSPYSFACYYLDAPCHTARGFPNRWSGHRALLNQLGWGFIVTYVGRQVSVGTMVGCGSDNLTRASGVTDGTDAVAKTRAEGFPAGTIIFLDVEGGGPLSASYLDYFRGWTAAVLASEFGTGIYCGLNNRMALATASHAEYFAADPMGQASAAFWIVSLTKNFSLLRDPGDCGVAWAAIWQGKFGVAGETHNGARIGLIDLDVALSPDPSAGRIAAPVT